MRFRNTHGEAKYAQGRTNETAAEPIFVFVSMYSKVSVRANPAWRIECRSFVGHSPECRYARGGAGIRRDCRTEVQR